MVDILVRRASLFERLFPQVHDGAENHPRGRVQPGRAERDPAPAGEPERDERLAADRDPQWRSGGSAATWSLGQVATVLAGAPAGGKLEVGDVIVGAKGEVARKTSSRSLSTHTPRDARSVRRSPRRTGARDRGRHAPRRTESAVPSSGSWCSQSFASRSTSGSTWATSAGPRPGSRSPSTSMTRNRRGHRPRAARRRHRDLDLDGRVGPIGGIEQKTLGARAVDADVFLVPDLNAEAARRRADDDVQVIPVSTFQEALSALTTPGVVVLANNLRNSRGNCRKVLRTTLQWSLTHS